MKKHLWPRRTPEAGLMGLSAITREEEFGRLDLARAGGASGVGGALEEREGQSRQYRAALRLSNMSTQLRGSRPNQERRNARERSRVHQVNHGFDLLRTRVPKAVINKKLSKADTLREAVRYIQYLKSLLHTEEGMNQTGYTTPTCSGNNGFYNHSEMEFDVYFPTPTPSSATSQHPSPVHSMYSSTSAPQSENTGGRPFA